jgi:TonB-dependent receptor
LHGFAVYNFPNYFRGKIDSPFGVDGRLYYSGNPALDYSKFVSYANAVQQTWQPLGPSDVRNQGWNSLYNRRDDIPGTPFDRGEVNPQDEKNTAAYAMLNLSHKMDNGWKLTGNLGVRFTRTSRTAEGGTFFRSPSSAFDDDTTCAANLADILSKGNSLSSQTPFCKLSIADRQALRDYQNGAWYPSTIKFNYSYALPSINLKLDVGSGLIFRADYFKGVTPQSFGLTRNFFNVNVQANDFNPITTSAYMEGIYGVGNPRLKPTQADNFDLTTEWYFSDVGSVTLAGFYKRLTDVLTSSTYRANLPNNGQALNSVINQPINSTDSGTVMGLELGYQQTFDFLPGLLNGLGINFNYTYLKSSGVKQNTLSATDADVAAGNVTTVDISKLPLEGLSKASYNIGPFYQKGPFEVRLAYSWRSRYLLTARDVIVPFQPIYNEANGYLDGSVFYSINSHIKLGLQVANILNEVERTRAVINNELQTAPRSWLINDTRYTASLRWTF